MPKRRHNHSPLQALPLFAAIAVALSLFLAHNSPSGHENAAHAKTPLQQNSPPPINPGDKDDKQEEKPSDDPKGNNPETPPADPDNKPPPDKPPNPDGKKPVPEPGVPSIPE
jgi:hypothetical protein